MKPRRSFRRRPKPGRQGGGGFFSRSTGAEKSFFAPSLESGSVHRSSAAPSGEQGLRTPELRAHPVFQSILSGGSLLRHGHQDAGAVRVLQSLLSRLGRDPGPLDGIWGPKTSGALIAFQGDQGLMRDGILGPLTLAAMDHAASAKAEEEMPDEPPDPLPLGPLLQRIGSAETPDAQTLADIETLLTIAGAPVHGAGSVLRLDGDAGEPQQTDGLGLLIAALNKVRRSVPGPKGEEPPETLGETHNGINTSDGESKTWWYWQNSMLGFIALFRGWRTQRQTGRKSNEKALAGALFAIQHVGKVDATAEGKDGTRRDWPLLHRIFDVSCKKDFYDTNRRAAVRTAGARLDSWCGIFTNYACLSMGVTSGRWPDPGFVKWKAFEFKQFNIPDPKPGDVMNAPQDKNNHFAFCLEYDPATHRITTIDGNSAPGGGASGGKIVVQKRHRSWWRGFWQAPV